VAYVSPGIQPNKALPSFRSGWACGQASDGAGYWRNLTVAFAPFLGPTNDPTKLLFGTAIRAGTSSFSGGRSTPTPGGWGWEFTSTGDGIVCCTAVDLVPIISAGIMQGTILIGFRSTDGASRNTYLYGTGTNNFNNIGLRHISDGRYVQIDTSLAGPAWTPAAGYNLRDHHVFSDRRGGGSGEVASPRAALFADGQIISTGVDVRSYVPNGNFHIGEGSAGATGDLNVVQFLYFWNRCLSDSDVMALSADPGVLFRPRTRGAVGKAGAASPARRNSFFLLTSW
jgi:hypothetical protein